MKILLIRVPELDFADKDKPVEKRHRPSIVVPQGILHLGSWVKAKLPDVEVRYLDMQFPACQQIEAGNYPETDAFIRQELLQVMADFTPEIIGLSCSMNAYAASLHLCALEAKRLAPHATVVAGGHYPSSFSERVARDPHVDFVVVGEGELPFTELIRNLQNRTPPADPILNTKEYIEDFDAFPPLDWDGIDIRRYHRLLNAFGMGVAHSVTLLSSRGCPMPCTYCATHNVWDRGFRAHTPETMVQMVSHLKETYGIDTFVYIDDNFLINKKRTKEFCRLLLERNLQIKWSPSSVQVNSLDEESIELMAQAGCEGLVLAIESGSPEVQKMIRKRVRLDHAREMAACLKRNGMKSQALFIFGFPGETLAQMEQTIQYARSLECDWFNAGIATPLYGTEMYQTAFDKGWLPKEVENTNVPLEGMLDTPDFTKEEVEDILITFNYRLNFLDNRAFLDGRYDDIQPFFAKVARRYPDHFIAKYMLFLIHTRRDEPEQAQAMARELLALRNARPAEIHKLAEKFGLDLAAVESAGAMATADL